MTMPNKTYMTIYLYAKFTPHATTPHIHILASTSCTPPVKSYYPIGKLQSKSRTKAILDFIPPSWRPPEPLALQPTNAAQSSFIQGLDTK